MQSFDNYIGGQWVGASRTVANINPSDTSDVIGDYSQADDAQVSAALEAAESGFAAWSGSGVQQRFDVLDAIGTQILARKEELGTILSREEGKTLPEGIGEAARAGQIFKFYAGEVLRLTGEILPSTRPGIDVEICREPLGVIGVITPWNFPIAIPAWKIAPALAYGNSVIFKPASLAPGSAWALSEIISRAGLPDGAFQLLMGSGGTVGKALLDDSRVRGVSFTGSVGTGGLVASSMSARGAKFQLEMGGKNPLVVLDDADFDTAISCAVNGAFFSTGQRCTASSRLIVEAGIYDRFTEAMIEATGKLCVGNALDAETQIGPVVDQSQLDQNTDYLEIGKKEGANLAVGGERLSLSTDGFYMSPALFIDTDNAMRINREEIFGPVATIIKADDVDHAVEIANDTPFGLSAGICTQSLASATHFKRRSQAGMVMINLPTAGVDYHVPFGGTKGSSYGSREQGKYAAEFYTTVKTTYIQV